MQDKKRILLTTSAAPSHTPFSTSEKRPPLGIGYLISVLRNAGHEVYFIDNYLYPSRFLDTDYLQRNKIDFVGIYTNTICFRDTLRMVFRLDYLRHSKEWKGKLIVGGPQTTVAPETIPAFVDYVVQGEGERAILDIVEGKINTRFIRYPPIANLDDLPMPAWDYFIPLPYKWTADWFEGQPVFTMNTSRGCPFQCTFCSVGSIWGEKYTYFSAERVVSEIESIVQQYGARGVYFREDNFTLNKKRLESFCNLIINKDLKIHWACESRVDTLDEEVLKLMYRAGARAFYFGVESGSQKVLDFLKKGIRIEQVKKVFKLCREIGFKTAASVIHGVPSETEDDLQKTEELLKEIKPDMTWRNIFVGIPNSDLYQYVLKNNLYEFIDDRGLIYLKGHNQRVKCYYGSAWDAAIPVSLNRPKLSVIMSVYNAERHLESAIRSVLNQTYPNFEFIIIDDASTDKTKDLLREITDARVKIIHNEKNLGLTKSLNKAVQIASGKFLARMDGDDLSAPHRFEQQLTFLENDPEYAMVGSSYYQINQDDRIISVVKVLTDDLLIKKGLEKQNWFGHGSVMIRKEAFDKVGGYDERFLFAQDYDLWLRLSELGKVANIEEPLYFWRVSSTGISTKKEKEQKEFAQLAVAEAQKRRKKQFQNEAWAETPLVSVIVPTYNRPHMLSEALRSILAQTYQNYEIIVINDGGEDVEKVVSNYNEKGCTSYVKHGRNRGLAAARNTGIKVAKGKYLAYLDDDDVFYPDHLETLAKFLISDNYKVAYTDAHRVHHKMVDGKYLIEKKDIPYSYDFDFERILRENYIPVLCIMHEKSCLDRVGTFDETLASHEDWDLWMRMSREFKFARISKVTCAFSWREDGSTMTSGQKQKMLLSRAIVSRRGKELQTKPVFPKDGYPPRDDAGSQYDKIQSLLNSQKWEEAISELESHLAVYPLNAIAHNDLAALASQNGDWEKALRHYQTAVNLDIANPTFKKNLGEFHFVVRKDFKSAVQILLEVLKAQPTDMETLMLLGTVCLQSNRMKDAEFFFHRAAELDPSNEKITDLLRKAREEDSAVANRLRCEDKNQDVDWQDSGFRNRSGGALNKDRDEGCLVSGQAWTHSAGQKQTEKDIEASDPVKAQAMRERDRSAIGNSERVKRIQPTCSIVIPVFNKVEFTRKCLEAIRKKTKAELYELVVVDNGSTDGTKEYLKSLGGFIRVISNKGNRGFAIACNQGAKLATGKLLLFLNNDVEPCSGWLEPLMSLMEGDPSIAAVGSKLLFPEGTIQHAGVVIINDKKIKDPLVARHIYYRQAPHLPEANQIRTYQALTAACLLVRKTAFADVGGFDERYWNGYEDIDLCFKLQEKGWNLVYNPESVLIHHESVSGPERFSRIPENISLLHQKWLGKIKPDSVVEENGEVHKTQTESIKVYQVPEGHPQGKLFTTTPIDKGLVSIVILTFNQLEFTRKCVESIQRHTPERHELIFIDNGSTDGTKKWLRKLIKGNHNYGFIENKTNLGFAKGCNQGIAAAKGEYLLLLNNDVVVTPTWLSGMQECLNRNPNIGIVGPMTNQISGIQKIPTPHPSIEHLDKFAREFRERNLNRRIPSRRIVGFCMLFRKELVDRIGSLDESFGTGNFEDDDFCLRAELGGYSNMIAGDVFIHHYGSRSFIGNQIDYLSSMGGNRKIFFDKWKGIDYKSPLGRKLLCLQEKEEAWKFYHQDQLEKAAEKFLTALKISPQDEDLYPSFAEMLIDAKRYQEAFDILKETPQEKKNDQIFALKGYCLEGLGKIEEGHEFLEKSFSVKPGNAMALNLKGILAYRRGQKEEAVGFFQNAIHADSGYGEPYTNLGVIKWEGGEEEDALNWLERGFILSPTGTDNLQLYHSAVSERGAFERSEKFLVEAEALYPAHKKIQYLLIDILLRQEKNEAAMERIEKCIAHFGLDEGMIKAALEVRKKIGPIEIAEKKEKGTVSLCMIVKDEEKYLARCLQSAKTIVDEMIVVDTGSSERTKELATIFGAKVYDFAWENDFSSARNFSLSKASGDWILVLDADEVISANDHPLLQELTSKKRKDPVAYSFVTRNYVNGVDYLKWNPNEGLSGEEKGSGWFPSEKVRLFPRDSRFYFENAIHEVVEPTILLHKIPILKCPTMIHHFGKLDEEKTLRKGNEYFALGKKKFEKKGSNLQSLKELAVQAGNLGRFEEAIVLWKQLLGFYPQLTEAYINLSANYIKLNRYPEAAEASQKAIGMDPSCQEALINYALAHYWMGNLRETISCLKGMDSNGSAHPLALGLLSLSHILIGEREKSYPFINKLTDMGFDFKAYLIKSVQELSAQGREKDGELLLEMIEEGGMSGKELSTHSDMQNESSAGKGANNLEFLRKAPAGISKQDNLF